MKIPNFGVVRTAVRQLRVQISLDVPATLRNTAAVSMESRKLREKTSRVATRFHPIRELLVDYPEIEAHVEISPSSGFTTRNTEAARDSGMVDARVTIIDSKPKRNARASASSRKERVSDY